MIDKLFNTEIVSHRIQSHIGDEHARLEVNGQGRSTYAYSHLVDVGFSKLNEENQAILNKISKLSLSKKDVSMLQLQLLNFIQSQYSEILKLGLRGAGNIDVSKYNFQESFDLKKRESISFVNYEIELMRHGIIRRRKEKWWDLGKILIAAIVGSALTYLVKR